MSLWGRPDHPRRRYTLAQREHLRREILAWMEARPSRLYGDRKSLVSPAFWFGEGPPPGVPEVVWRPRSEDSPMTIAFIDVEASGFMGFPVEVAWCAGDLSAGGSWLIQPDFWAEGAPALDPPDWDPNAELVHGLALHRLRAEGLPPATVAQALRDDLAAVDVVLSDSPGTDWRWLADLFVAGEVDGVPHPVYATDVPDLAPRLREATDEEKRTRRKAHKEICAAVGLQFHHALDDTVRQAIGISVARGVDPAAITTRARAVLLQHGRPETRKRLALENGSYEPHRP